MRQALKNAYSGQNTVLALSHYFQHDYSLANSVSSLEKNTKILSEPCLQSFHLPFLSEMTNKKEFVYAALGIPACCLKTEGTDQ